MLAKHSQCTLSFLGGCDFKILIVKNCENEAQICQKVRNLHRDISEVSLTDFF